MILSWGSNLEHSKWVINTVRSGAPNTLIGSGLPTTEAYSSTAAALRLAGELRSAGTDVIYCSGLLPKKFAPLCEQKYPCCGHVGYLPVENTWFGGPRAVGKTWEEAVHVYKTTKALEEAGCIGVEMECVPAKVAAEITKRTKLLVFSMGSGAQCDGQFLFASDLMGTNTGHYPRHSITYSRMFEEAIRVFTRYREDVTSGAYPAENHQIKIKDEQFERFLAAIGD
jgi:3-methyl-2-oxobutanoate hydroxymethyltransferase